MTLEYGLDYSETSSQNMYYTVEGPNINYILQLDNGVKAHNWEVDLGVILEISPDMITNLVVDGKEDQTTHLTSQVFLIMISRSQKFVFLSYVESLIMNLRKEKN